MTAEQPPDPMAVMDQSAAFIAAITGTRAQLLAQGWDKDHAEQIVVALHQNLAALAWQKALGRE